jgi:hypothetical protein
MECSERHYDYNTYDYIYISDPGEGWWQHENLLLVQRLHNRVRRVSYTVCDVPNQWNCTHEKVSIIMTGTAVGPIQFLVNGERLSQVGNQWIPRSCVSCYSSTGWRECQGYT